MNIPFDKIYIISFVLNKEKRDKMKYILDNILQIHNYEFIYGIDVNALIKIINYNNFKYNYDNPNDSFEYKNSHISCSITHFTALQHAYINEYEKILIIEDDAQFINDVNYIEYVFNNYPSDADILQYGITWRSGDVYEKYKNEIWLKNIHSAGTQCYAILNRQTIKHYIDIMIKQPVEIDNGIFLYNKNVYQLRDLICKDPNSQLIDKNKLLVI